MFRVTLPVLAAFATLATAGTANAQCCGASGGLFTSGYGYSSGWGNSGWGTGCGGCGTSYVAAPIVVQAQPIVVQQPVVVQQPIVVQQQQPVVQQYVVNQGPVYSGPGITRLSANYYPPRAVGAYPYVGNGYRWGGYRRAAWAGPRYGHYHRYHGPVRRYY
jgi:hypothetical protein